MVRSAAFICWMVASDISTRSYGKWRRQYWQSQRGGEEQGINIKKKMSASNKEGEKPAFFFFPCQLGVDELCDEYIHCGTSPIA